MEPNKLYTFSDSRIMYPILYRKLRGIPYWFLSGFHMGSLWVPKRFPENMQKFLVRIEGRAVKRLVFIQLKKICCYHNQVLVVLTKLRSGQQKIFDGWDSNQTIFSLYVLRTNPCNKLYIGDSHENSPSLGSF